MDRSEKVLLQCATVLLYHRPTPLGVEEIFLHQLLLQQQFLPAGQKERLWRKFFADPSQWWDGRLQKVNAKYPDFKHKKTHEVLWLDDRQKPLWVEAEMDAMALRLDRCLWNRSLARNVKAGRYEKAMEIFQQMQEQGMSPDKFTFLPVLNACASLQALEQGRHAHEQIVKSCCESNVFVGTSLVDMYAKCGSLEDAWRVFNKMPSRNVVSWNVMILGHVKCGQGHKALELFQQMQHEGLQPSCVTFTGVLNACASVVALEEGRHAHEQIILCGYDSNEFVQNSLIDMYAKCGSMEDAWRVFSKIPSPHVVSWNAMISGYVRCGQGQNALELFRKMQQEGVQPDGITFVGVLNACASVVALEEGRQAHEKIIQSGCELDVFVGNSLIDMYVKCGSMEDAWRVFNKMPSHDVVSWSAMLLGLVKQGQGQYALELFQQMQQEGVQPGPVTFVAVLNACASVLALEEGRHVHEQLIQHGCDSNIFVQSSLVNMYAKCGSMEDAWRVFYQMPSQNVVSWTAMLHGYAMHGLGNEALAHFERMCQQGVKINDVTFVCLLSACSHAGLADEGLHYFDSMGSVYCISATLENYACIVDLLGRAGRLLEAEDFVNTMPFEPNVDVWKTLLGACKIHGHVQMGERIAKRVVDLDPADAASYVLLSKIYAAAGKWDLSVNVKQHRKESSMKKQPDRMWIGLD
ncbi:hypothetical protein BDL97_01G050500 [Sphagnum fallax]|nr:hypothetical protein BDL97_01G050500 [Sphagnum fallax]